MPRAEVRPDRAGLMRALLLSIAAAAVPIAGTFLFPEDQQDYEALTWLLLLVPAFLWAYERGWRGIATAMAAGMATVSMTYAVAEIAGRQVPDLLLAVIVIYLFISLAIGVFGERVGRAKFDAAAETLALQDPLTGLPNRRHAELHLDMQYAAAERGQSVAVVLFDLDHFGTYNERNGRAAGDGVLKIFATMLRQHTRRMDLAARYGPEEFIAVLSGCSEEGALIFAGRLQERLRAAEHMVALPTVSAGIASYRPDMSSMTELMQAAEQALLLAKRDGRDRVRIHGRKLSELRQPDAMLQQRLAAEATVAGATAALNGVRAGLAAGPDPLIGAGRSAFVLSADAALRGQLGGYLRSQGFVVTEGELLTDTMVPLTQDFDLVFVDVAHRGTPAADMTRHIRERSPSTRVIGIPRTEGGALRAEALNVRVDAHYLGLSNPDALEQQLVELLAERDALREAQVRQHVMTNELRALDRQARLALAASEAKYRTVVQSIQEVIFSTDVDGNWTFLNPAWTAITGFSIEESIGQPLFRFLHPDDETTVRAQFHETLTAQAHYFRHEGRWRTRSGPHRWVELRLQRALSPTGAVEGTSGVLADVTERRRAEDALRRSEQYFRSLIENSGDMMAVLNADGTFRYVSPAVERVFGYQPDELLGADPLKFVHPEDEDETRRGLGMVLDQPGATMTAELRMRHRDGRWRHIEITCRNLLLTPGVDGIVINGRDVTERYQAELALRESEQTLLRAQKMDAIGRLAGGVAHDFNNLLTAIHGHADLLIADLPEEHPIRDDLLEIRDAAQRATALTRQLLAFSRRQVLQPRVIELNGVIRGMENMLRRVIGEHLTLTTQLAADAGCVRADPTQLEQVLLNLVVNARDALPDGGVVSVATALREITEADAVAPGLAPGSYVMLRVSDDGTGMTDAVAAQAFEPFFTTKAAGEGTGLGLSTVYGIVKQSGGDVWLQTEPDAGTEVIVALPVADEPVMDALVEASRPAALVEASRPAAVQQRGDETILLVEDEKTVRELALRILQRQGYNVIAAAGGKEALELLSREQQHVDLLLTDVVMPEINGQDLAALVRRHRPDLPVLFMSGYNEEAVLHDGVLADDTSFLEKPFSPGALLQLIRQILDNGAAADDARLRAPAAE